MKVNVPIEFDDNFEPGCCNECPLSYQEFDDLEYFDHCVFFSRYDECPLQELEEFKESQDV